MYSTTLISKQQLTKQEAARMEKNQTVSPSSTIRRVKIFSPDSLVQRNPNALIDTRSKWKQTVSPSTTVRRKQNVSPGMSTSRKQTVSPGMSTSRKQTVSPGTSSISRKQTVSPGTSTKRKKNASPGMSTSRKQTVSPETSSRMKDSSNIQTSVDNNKDEKSNKVQKKVNQSIYVPVILTEIARVYLLYYLILLNLTGPIMSFAAMTMNRFCTKCIDKKSKLLWNDVTSITLKAFIEILSFFYYLMIIYHLLTILFCWLLLFGKMRTKLMKWNIYEIYQFVNCFLLVFVNMQYAHYYIFLQANSTQIFQAGLKIIIFEGYSKPITDMNKVELNFNKNIIHFIQQTYECCGSDNFKQYLTYVMHFKNQSTSETIKNANKMIIVPWSCCNIKYSEECLVIITKESKTDAIYNEGCNMALAKEFSKSFSKSLSLLSLITGILLSNLIIFQLIRISIYTSLYYTGHGHFTSLAWVFGEFAKRINYDLLLDNAQIYFVTKVSITIVCKKVDNGDKDLNINSDDEVISTANMPKKPSKVRLKMLKLVKNASNVNLQKNKLKGIKKKSTVKKVEAKKQRKTN